MGVSLYISVSLCMSLSLCISVSLYIHVLSTWLSKIVTYDWASNVVSVYSCVDELASHMVRCHVNGLVT